MCRNRRASPPESRPIIALLTLTALAVATASGCSSSVHNVYQARDLLRREPVPVVAVLPLVNYSGVNLARLPQRIPLDMQIAGFPGLVSDRAYDWLAAARLALATEMREHGFIVVPVAEVDAALAALDDDAVEANGSVIGRQRALVADRCAAGIVVYAAVEAFDLSRLREDRAITINLTAVAEDATSGQLRWRRVSGPTRAELPDSRAYTAFTFFDVELFIDSNPPSGFLPWLAQSVAHMLTDDFRKARED